MRPPPEEISLTEQDGDHRSDEPVLAIDCRLRLSITRLLIIYTLVPLGVAITLLFLR